MAIRIALRQPTSTSSAPPVVAAAIENSHQRSSGRSATQLRTRGRDSLLRRHLDRPGQDAEFPAEEPLDLVAPLLQRLVAIFFSFRRSLRTRFASSAMALQAARGSLQRTIEFRESARSAPQAEVLGDDDRLRCAPPGCPP